MAQSYIPAGKALLNTCDKKLSCQLQCRIKVSYYEGLSSLLLGLALGAAVVALTVLTFGAGTAVVAAAVLTTGALGGAAIFYGDKADKSRQAPHECDSTKGGTWELYHSKVYIEKANALLERSFLTCKKGGVVSLVMSHEKALELSKKISDSNKKILELNYYSNASQGFIGSVANAFKASGDARKILKGEQAELEADGSILKPEMGRDAGVSGVLTAGEASVGVIGSNGEVLKTLGRWGAEEVSQGNNVSRAFWRVFAGRTAKNVGKQMVSESIKGIIDKTNLQKLGVGVVASMISNSIELGINKMENNLYKEMLKTINQSRDQSENKINIQACQS